MLALNEQKNRRTEEQQNSRTVEQENSRKVEWSTNLLPHAPGVPPRRDALNRSLYNNSCPQGDNQGIPNYLFDCVICRPSGSPLTKL